MGWKWHFKGNVCPLKIRMVQGIQVPFFNGLGRKGESSGQCQT